MTTLTFSRAGMLGGIEAVLLGSPDDLCLHQAFATALLSQGDDASIARRPYVADITLADCEAVIREFELPIEIVKIAGVKKLRFEPDLDKRWFIVKLLDDDFLRSSLTKAKYETNSKVARA